MPIGVKYSLISFGDRTETHSNFDQGVDLTRRHHHHYEFMYPGQEMPPAEKIEDIKKDPNNPGWETGVLQFSRHDGNYQEIHFNLGY